VTSLVRKTGLALQESQNIEGVSYNKNH